MTEMPMCASARDNPWHRAGQHAIMLADVVEVDPPEPCIGGLGFFAFERHDCGRPVAHGMCCPCTRPAQFQITMEF